MALKLMYITNDTEVAKIAEKNGVDWIFIDLEIYGKEDRQKNLNTVISRHNIEDVKKIKSVLKKSELLVRVNPINKESKEEIDKVINDGADIVMLPYFHSKEEAEQFISYVNGRAKTCLLLETPKAVDNIDSILTAPGIDYIHIGLNDLHLGYKMKFMYELLSNGTVEFICNKIRQKKITYGFGGIAQIGHGGLPAENIIAEHYRLGSSMAILSRSFCDANKTENMVTIENIFKIGMRNIRNYESMLMQESIGYFESNKDLVKKRVTEILTNL